MCLGSLFQRIELSDGQTCLEFIQTGFLLDYLLFMVIFIIKLKINNYDSFSCLSKANYNAGLHYLNVIR